MKIVWSIQMKALSKGKIALIIILSVILLVGIMLCMHCINTHCQSKKYNLVKADKTISITQNNAELEEGYIELTDINMHYYMLGEGYPLILVHGNGGDYESLLDLGRYLAKDYKVYLVENRCHGKSSVTDKIDYDLMAADLKDFIIAMSIDKPIVIGLSDGGINALTMAINYPDLLKAIVSFGANTHPDEFKFYFRFAVKIMDVSQKSILNTMMLTEPNITVEELKSIKIPAFIVAGEFDIMKLRDSVKIAENIPNAQFAIVEGADHTSYVRNGIVAYNLIKDFLFNATH